jgi:hypothetical protein
MGRLALIRRVVTCVDLPVACKVLTARPALSPIRSRNMLS